MSRTTPTKINKDVVPKPLKLETFKIPSIIFGRVANIANIIEGILKVSSFNGLGTTSLVINVG